MIGKDPRTWNFQDGEILLLDKPYTWTSFDVVNHVRISLRDLAGIPKIKVGHAGTLDPLASGLLIICTGKATRQIENIQGLDKTYTGTMQLGATTPSHDLETQIDHTFPWEHLDEKMLHATAASFIGVQEQVPPIYSAVHVDGRRAYKIARKKSANMVLPAREVTVHHFQITRIALPDVDFELCVSKGTYIRSIVYDFGLRCGSGAHLTDLRRTASGDYHVKDAFDPITFRTLIAQI